MDTMLILRITLLLVVAVVPSYSDNKTAPVGSTTTAEAPIKVTTAKLIEVLNASNDDSLTTKLRRGLGTGSFGDTTGFKKRQDPSFSTSLTSFDEPSSIISTGSVTGFSGGKSGLTGSFDIDDIDVKPNPSFGIDGPSIKGSSSFSIEGPNIKDTTSFDIDTPSFSLDGASFNIDGGTFYLDTPSFDVEGAGVKGNPSFNIDTADFHLAEPNVKSIPSFELDFHNAKRSTSYNTDPIIKSNPLYNLESPNVKNIPYESESYKSEVYRPEASSISSTSSLSPTYDSISKKNYNYPKNTRQTYSAPQSSYSKPVYSSTSPGPVYSDSRVQYAGSQTTPNSQVYNNYGSTPYYENYVTPSASGSITDRARPISNLKSVYSNPPEVSTPQKIQGYAQSQNSFKNNLFNGQGAFGGEYPAFQNLNQNSFPQGGGSLQYSGSPATQTSIYNSQYSGPKTSQQVYSPTQQTAISFSPSTQSFEKLSTNLAYTSTPLEYTKRATSLPIVQIQNGQDFPKFIQAVESEPVVLTTGSNIKFQTAPNFGLSFDFGKGGGNQPFLVTTDRYHQQQPQILPVQTSSSTPQFPQYKGASITAHSRSDYGKKPGSYQALANQPQLHFNTNGQSINKPQVFTAPKISEKIKEDVEIIKNKKAPAPPQNDDEEEEEEDDDDDESGEGYKSIEREYGQSDDDESSEPQADSEELDSSERFSGEEPEFKSSMPPMPPFVFKPYDDKVGRLHEFVSQPEPQNRFSEEAEDDEEYTPKNYTPTKPPIAEYDQKSPKPYFSHARPKPSITAYDENEDDANTRKRGREDDESEASDFPVKGLKALRSYERQYQKKIDDPYKKEPLQTKYAYSKQVPQVSQLTAEDSTTYPKMSKYSRGKNYAPKSNYRSSYDSGESTERSIKTGTRKPTKRPYKNNEDQETITSFKTDPKVVHEESFGYKIPKKVEKKDRHSSSKKSPTEDSYSRFTKDNDGVEYSSVRKTPTEDSYVQGRRGSYKSDSPKNEDTTSYENGDSYSFSSGKNWKSNKKSPETTDSQSGPTQEVRHIAYITEDDYNFFSPERIRPGLSGSIFRDFIDVY